MSGSWTSGCPNSVLGFRWGVAPTLTDEDWLRAQKYRRSQGGWTDGDVWVGPVCGSADWVAYQGDLEARGATPKQAISRLASVGPGVEPGNARGDGLVPSTG